jgi:hypothetical protein
VSIKINEESTFGSYLNFVDGARVVDKVAVGTTRHMANYFAQLIRVKV